MTKWNIVIVILLILIAFGFGMIAGYTLTDTEEVRCCNCCKEVEE